MLHKHTTIVEAYKVLGLDDGTSLEVVKSTYKQMALKTHPDKNPDNEDATAQFQQLSEAYNVLLKHLDTSSPPPHTSRYDPFASESEDDDYEDDDDYYYFEADGDEYYSDDEEDMAFYMFLFEQLLNSRSSRFNQQQFFHSRHQHFHHDHMHEPPESPEQYQARLRRTREEQEAAAERRQREETLRKAAQEEQREKERKEAGKRREAKATKKKAQAEASRKSAEQKARAQQKRSQTLRSGVFAAARSGDTKKVQTGVWEESVDAAGGEVKPGCDVFVETKPKDSMETLSHIAASRGDAELLEWLDTHGADLEERDSKGQTPFHVALIKGHLPILRYLFDAHSPKDDDTTMYASPPDTDLLSMALSSCEPEVFWITLDNDLASADDMSKCWAYITSTSGKNAVLKMPINGPKKAQEKLEEFTNLLIKYGGFTVPSPEAEEKEEESDSQSSTSSEQTSPEASNNKPQRKQQRTAHDSSPTLSSPSLPDQKDAPQNQAPYNGRDRGRGRGGGRGRGRERGRGYFRGRSGPPPS